MKKEQFYFSFGLEEKKKKNKTRIQGLCFSQQPLSCPCCELITETDNECSLTLSAVQTYCARLKIEIKSSCAKEGPKWILRILRPL